MMTLQELLDDLLVWCRRFDHDEYTRESARVEYENEFDREEELNERDSDWWEMSRKET